MRTGKIGIAFVIAALLAACAVDVVPRPYTGPIVIGEPVRPYIVGVTPLTPTSYSVVYVPGAVSEARIVTSFKPTCSSRGLVAVRGSGVTRRQILRRGQRAPRAVNVFTVTCR